MARVQEPADHEHIRAPLHLHGGSALRPVAGRADRVARRPARRRRGGLLRIRLLPDATHRPQPRRSPWAAVPDRRGAGAGGPAAVRDDPARVARLAAPLVGAGVAAGAPQRVRPDGGRGHLPRPVAGGLDVAHPRPHRARSAVPGGGCRAARSLGRRSERRGAERCDAPPQRAPEWPHGRRRSDLAPAAAAWAGRGGGGVARGGGAGAEPVPVDRLRAPSRDEKGHSATAQFADARTASTLDPWAVDPHYLEASALETHGQAPSGARAARTGTPS